MEDTQNEVEESKLNLLNKFDTGFIKFREIEETIDLFFPSQDLFIFLDESESVLFNDLIVNRRELDLQNPKEVDFILNLYNEQRR